jgi:small ligand-binding sensory domain FIST
VIGCSTSGVICPGREIDEGPVIGLIAVSSEALRATPIFFHDGGDHGLTAGIRLGQRLAASRSTDDLLLLLPDPFHLRPDHLLRAVDAVLGPVSVVGGAPSATPPGAPTFQFSGSEIGESAVAGLRLGGDFRYRVVVTHGSLPLGPPLRVTRSHDNLLLELEGRAAFSMLCEIVPEASNPGESWPGTLFLGVLDDPAADGTYTIRNIVSVDPDTGVVAVADSVEEGQHVVFLRRDGAAARRELAGILETIDPSRTGVAYRFGLYFDCVARGRWFYGEPDVDAKLIGRYLPDLPFLGMYSNAEIGPIDGENRLLTYSGVLLLVGDRD